MIVIADTSLINYLVLIEQIEVLPKLYGRILIPPSVYEELQQGSHPRSRAPLGSRSSELA
jgi:predicted nucleic acid-binding protein